MTEPRRGRIGNANKWHPKKWKPDYERIVGLACIGKMNKEIAEMTGYTKEHISTILNLPEAEELRALILTRVRETVVEDIGAIHARISVKTAKVIDKALSDDSVLADKRSLFAIIDRGLEISKGVGHLKTPGSPGVNVERGVILTGEQGDKFLAGMQKADAAKQLHSGLSLVKAVNE